MNRHEITRAAFYAKYGDVVVKFDSYYKYTFTFKATLPDGAVLSCGVGGNADEIYRHEISANETLSITSLQPYVGWVQKDGEEVDSFYDF